MTNDPIVCHVLIELPALIGHRKFCVNRFTDSLMAPDRKDDL